VVNVRDIVNTANNYRTNVGDAARVNLDLVGTIVEWVDRILKCFGLEIGGGQDAGTGESREDIATPFIQVLAEFRDGVRKLAQIGAGMKDLCNMRQVMPSF
jgi:hypothetical protein